MSGSRVRVRFSVRCPAMNICGCAYAFGLTLMVPNPVELAAFLLLVLAIEVQTRLSDGAVGRPGHLGGAS